MEIDDLPVATLSGQTLTLEERASLRPSLVLLRNAEALDYVSIWGKVLGLQKDYLVALGFQEHSAHVPAKFFFRSVLCLAIVDVVVFQIGATFILYLCFMTDNVIGALRLLLIVFLKSIY
jgi:hypothetical protein